jgi:tRNA(Ile)-lysidine synthase
MKLLIEHKILATIRTMRVLIPGDRVGVAVSGGADSVALLRLLENLRGELGVTLLVLHLDHKLRGEESRADAQFVADLARQRGLELVLQREDVAAEAKRRGWNLEDAARRLRHAFFQRVVEQRRATRVAVAHTADDQAETVLAHIIRGTGPAGLAGVYPIAACVVRPLLSTRRRHLREYLHQLGQPWREDSTNSDLHRLRARIRSQLLPCLERDFSPSIVRHLAQLARLSREEQVFWDALVERRFRACASGTRERLTLRIQDLLAPFGPPANMVRDETPIAEDSVAPWRALTERLIRRAYKEVRGDRRDLSAVHVEQLIRLATKSTSGRRTELPRGITVERHFDDLLFSREYPARGRYAKRETLASGNAYQYVVSLPKRGTTTVSVPELQSCFRLKVIDWPLEASETKRDSDALDADLLQAPLILRNWRAGDAYRPRGRRQAQKLKRMFLARRIPGMERSRWPVLESAGHVIWARGMPPAEEFCATESTRAGVLIDEDQS